MGTEKISMNERHKLYLLQTTRSCDSSNSSPKRIDLNIRTHLVLTHIQHHARFRFSRTFSLKLVVRQTQHFIASITYEQNKNKIEKGENMCQQWCHFCPSRVSTLTLVVRTLNSQNSRLANSSTRPPFPQLGKALTQYKTERNDEEKNQHDCDNLLIKYELFT